MDGLAPHEDLVRGVGDQQIIDAFWQPGSQRTLIVDPGLGAKMATRTILNSWTLRAGVPVSWCLKALYRLDAGHQRG